MVNNEERNNSTNNSAQERTHSTQSVNSAHRKRKALQASGMEEIINNIDKVDCISENQFYKVSVIAFYAIVSHML